jgi:hypothetical protein
MKRPVSITRGWYSGPLATALRIEGLSLIPLQEF